MATVEDNDKIVRRRPLSLRAALVVYFLAACVGWATILGLVFAGRFAVEQVAGVRSTQNLEDIAPAAGSQKPAQPAK